MSTDTIMPVLMSELRVLVSQTCDCDITDKHFTKTTMSCDRDMLTMSTELVYSDSDGNVTASSLLGSAASRLMGVRTFNEEILMIDMSCALRDEQGNCIEVKKI